MLTIGSIDRYTVWNNTGEAADVNVSKLSNTPNTKYPHHLQQYLSIFVAREVTRQYITL
jgi:hypothetical protein